MSLVISIGGKIESYYSFKRNNIKPITKKGPIDQIKAHEEEQENLEKHSPSNKKAQMIKESYAKQAEKPHHRLKKVLARDIMSSPVHAITKETSVREALKKLQNLNCHHLLVCEKELILGILSDRDLLKFALVPEGLNKVVSDVMTKEVILAEEDADIKVLANIMLKEKISSIPIINNSYGLEGIVTSTDLLRCLMNNMPLDVLV